MTRDELIDHIISGVYELLIRNLEGESDLLSNEDVERAIDTTVDSLHSMDHIPGLQDDLKRHLREVCKIAPESAANIVENEAG